jgi:geranylgeranyl pyrophosphate synthase
MTAFDRPDAVVETSLMSALLASEFEAWLGREVESEETAVLRRLFQRALLHPAQEFLNRPGKQFRGRLVARAWDMAGSARSKPPIELPLLVEILHAGSLIIDDIQDESTSRRGNPALHHLSGTATAINTANFFYFWSFDIIGRIGCDACVTLELYRKASATLLRCHKGQALDLSIRVCDLPQDQVPLAVSSAAKLKAGALMEFAAVLGATAGGAAAGLVKATGCFGRELGVALQKLDDLSGVTNEARIAKGLEDLHLSRLSWVWSWVARTTDSQTYEQYRHQALQVADGASTDELLAALRARLLGAREEISRELLASLDKLRVAIGDGAHIEKLRAEIDLLERTYV